MAMRIKNPQKLIENAESLRDGALKLLEAMGDTDETMALKEKLQKTNDVSELFEIIVEITKKAYQEGYADAGRVSRYEQVVKVDGN